MLEKGQIVRAHITMSHTHLWRVLALAAATGLSCATATPKEGGGASGEQGAPLSAEHATAMCVKLHEQGAQCLEPFSELLLELRLANDPRFAEARANPAMREELRQAVREETLADGTGPLEERTRRCTEYALHGPPVPASDPASLERCYALADCPSRVACMRPVLEQRFKARASGRGE
jgi:hypothetical protein